MTTTTNERLMTNAVHDLINRWTDVVDAHRADDRYVAVDHEPLLVMLRTAFRASTGRTSTGRTDASTRSVMNLQAFALWEQIANEVRYAVRKYTKDNPNPMLGYAMQHLAETVDALWASNQITENDYLHLISRAQAWRDQIWGLFHALNERELEFCPSCEQSKYINHDGEQAAALVAFYRDGATPFAKCRHCGEMWVGEGQLIILGRMLGATPDADVLDDMGAVYAHQGREVERTVDLNTA